MIYAVMNNGDLRWFRNYGYRDGLANWQGPIRISNGWDQFTHVFYGGDGIIYAVEPNGDLLWYRHDGWQDGSFNWANGGIPLKIGTGWTEPIFEFGATTP